MRHAFVEVRSLDQSSTNPLSIESGITPVARHELPLLVILNFMTGAASRRENLQQTCTRGGKHPVILAERGSPRLSEEQPRHRVRHAIIDAGCIVLGRLTNLREGPMSDKTSKRAVCVVAWGLSTAISACSPSVNSFTATPGTDVNLVDVAANVSDAAAINLQTPRLGARRAGTASFSDAGALTSGGGPNYSRTGLALPAGNHELQLTVPYRAVLQSATQTVTRTIQVSITEPAGCFFFDGGGTANWTPDGFFEIDTQPTPDVRVNVCAGQTPTLAVDVGANYPMPYQSPIPASFNSLGLPLRQTCFTDSPPPAVPNSQFIAVDLVSPNLAGQPGWSGANGVEVQVSSSFVATAPNTPVPRVQLAYQKSGGDFEFEFDAQGNPVFHATSGTWERIALAKAGTDVSSVRVRAFVPRDIALLPDNFAHVRIDRVCPLTVP